jgi:ubiquinone/menaquinone biosynthesis C-methylase UbiE
LNAIAKMPKTAKERGLEQIRYTVLAGGIIAIHRGVKPER